MRTVTLVLDLDAADEQLRQFILLAGMTINLADAVLQRRAAAVADSDPATRVSGAWEAAYKRAVWVQSEIERLAGVMPGVVH